MNDFQSSDMRALLSRAAPVPEEEPQVRDVVGPAIAWGERRRRVDRMLVATGAALAVLAVGAGVHAVGNGALGTGSGLGGAAVGPAGPGRSFPTSGGLGLGSGSCTLPNGAPGSTTFCKVEAQLQNFDITFASQAADLIAAKLPSGVTAERTGSYYLTLTKGSTREYLYPSLTPSSTLPELKEHCYTSDCKLQNVADGTAMLGTYASATIADWVPDAGPGPRITMLLATTAPGIGQNFRGAPLMWPGGPYGGPSYSASAGRVTSPSDGSADGSAAKPTLLTAQQMAEIVGDPVLRQYVNQAFNLLLQLIQEDQVLMANELPSIPGGYLSGSIPAGGIGGSASRPSAPLSMGTEPVSPSIPVGGTFLPPTCWLDAHQQCGPSPSGSASSAPATPLPSTPNR
jgi:hypothetical protein